METLFSARSVPGPGISRNCSGTSRNRRGPRSRRSIPLSSTAAAVGQVGLTAVPGGHHPCGAVEHRPKILAFVQSGGRCPSVPAASMPAAHPQRHPLLILASRTRRTHRRRGALEEEAPARLNSPAQRLITERPTPTAHRIRVCLPATGFEPSTSVNRINWSPKGQLLHCQSTSTQNATTNRLNSFGLVLNNCS